ncbi:tRNA (adenosine(37)-N6)-dimethylallyltransferase MiaA [Erythrobacter sp. JK5]|uniref:tRNA (adenosine(37)-N6)-dimethylallyltransferase MiaA n=1 Tax=Erythrobacter sp. JK5 TaxID=2829500 RepID=UPI001BA4D796|nr:tRNA (adenosine(37)-N6)-dimethylallyltransferase MiaA [Erythrobacter sp. JK5]QUL38828.1 tRNA (adenosine(37)-N6)-dimethylallyltransferase MiaA [Erythrobacter sp. JK5]
MSKGKTPIENRVALIAGPTASGKSGLALQLAQARAKTKLDTWIVNADSMQVYRDIPILSAAPSEKERKQTPHRIYGEWEAQQTCSAADWAGRAKGMIAEAHEAGALPVLVGGTGMYMKVLLEGIAPIPEIDPEIRAVVRGLDTEDAYAALMIEDPERATQLDRGDSQRIARALEVKRSTGTTLADWQLAKTGGIEEDVDLTAVVLLPDRDWLYERCDTRFEAMLNAGAISEVEELVKRGLDPALPIMRAIGVPEIAAHLAGEFDRKELFQAGAQATRNYAKRQYTWFRRQPPESWARLTEGAESKSIDLDDVFGSLLRQ